MTHVQDITNNLKNTCAALAEGANGHVSLYLLKEINGTELTWLEG